MSIWDEKREVSVLLADVTGSTSLYEKTGNSEALAQIQNFLGQIRRIVSNEGGNFIHSKGDDVLCTFKEPSGAIKAAKAILNKNLRNNLSIHAGLHHGEIIKTDDDIYGDCVNVCARLASLANPGEVLLSQIFVDQLSKPERSTLRVLDDIKFKGKDEAIRVYTLLAETTSQHTGIGATTFVSDGLYPAAEPNVSIELIYGDQKLLSSETSSITIGRSDENDLVVAQPWVSRQHATVSVVRNKAQLVDRSSGCTYIAMGKNPELPALRETVLLIGSGTISPTLSNGASNAEIIKFNVITTR